MDERAALREIWDMYRNFLKQNTKQQQRNADQCAHVLVKAEYVAEYLVAHVTDEE
jgi:hypothetical protein